MAFGAGQSKKGELQAAINVTPLVDVVLVLLIIFMVVTPMLSRGKQVELPRSLVVETSDPQRSALVLSITADRQLWLEDRALAPDDLAPLLQRALAARGDRALLVKADASLSVSDLRATMRVLKGAKLRQLAFAVSTPEAGP